MIHNNTPSSTPSGSTSATEDAEQMNPPPGGVTIRMYRQGLGDAFLLGFHRGEGDQGRPVYVLIDCGVILGTPEPKNPLTAVVDAIYAETAGHLDVLIITHEHWDHVGSFQQVFALWERFTVETVWMAWTEDPQDPLGIQLKQQFKNDLDALCLTVQHQRAGDSSDKQALAQQAADTDPDDLPETSFSTLVSLFGDPEHVLHFGHDGLPLAGTATASLAAAGGASFGKSTHVGMKNARMLATKHAKPVSYLKPGDICSLPGIAPEAVRVYVLGPPRNANLLRNINPSIHAPETYSEQASASLMVTPIMAPTEKAAFTLAVRSLADGGPATELTPDEREIAGLCLPFDGHIGIEIDRLKAAAQGTLIGGAPIDPVTVAFFQNRYGFGPSTIDAPEWRQIEKDWLGVAGELALQMDSYTNNTSLALAFELKDGTVLLFPADAQVGNWISWDHIQPPFATSDGRTVTAADLLARTRFYKVGHHGSHNATMRTIGLERMIDPSLIAFVPVDEEIAHTKKHWTEMPFDPLMARLYEKTGGRVVRADMGVVTASKPRFLSATIWDRLQANVTAFANEVVRSGHDDPRMRPDAHGANPLYYEVNIPLPPTSK